MPIYRLPTHRDITPPLADVPRFVAKVMRDYHKPLTECKLKVDILLAFPAKDDNGEPIEDAITAKGYPALAKMENRSPKLRAQGFGDVLLTIDAHNWPDLDPAEQTALIDHELTHVELILNDAGRPKEDDYGRPKTKMRLHDRQFGWFDSVAQRHPLSSFEIQQASDLIKIDELRQTYFPEFADAQLTKSKPRKKRA